MVRRGKAFRRRAAKELLKRRVTERKKREKLRSLFLPLVLLLQQRTFLTGVDSSNLEAVTRALWRVSWSEREGIARGGGKKW